MTPFDSLQRLRKALQRTIATIREERNAITNLPKDHPKRKYPLMEITLDSSLIVPLIAIVILLCLSAFFSGSETSMTAASRARMHTLEEDGDKRAAIVNSLWDRKERLIGAILLGNNLVNILASALATSVLITLFGETGVVYATLVMTALVLIFAEVLPKTYALRNAEKAALFSAVILRPIVWLLGPVVMSVEAIVHGTLKLFPSKQDQNKNSESKTEELRGAIALHEAEEARHETKMLRSILDLDDVSVEEIMTHRQQVMAVNIEEPSHQIVREVLSSPYTRIPLWRDRPDNIVGVLHAKALLRIIEKSLRNDSAISDGLPQTLTNEGLLEIATAPWFIPASTSLLAQLHAFRDRREHFAIVVDEYGEMQGIVTLEDILEEIVGDITDEHDEQMEGVVYRADDSWEVDGTVTLRDLNRKFEWKLPDDQASTVAGLLLYHARQIPRVGQSYEFLGKRFVVLERKRHQITKLRISELESDRNNLSD